MLILKITYIYFTYLCFLIIILVSAIVQKIFRRLLMLIRSAEQDIERVLYTEKAIAARVEEIGTELTKSSATSARFLSAS